MFTVLTKEDFLKNYWQKKPCLFRNALPEFRNPLSPDELAGLSLEEEIESRIVYQTEKAPFWYLKKGPFHEKDFNKLAKTHWTLLVQGVDRFIPEVTKLLDNFNFIPQWRVDDVMISYAVENGSVGPHYDNYDVFLYQAMGRRHWKLTTKNCQPENYLEGVPLRIMKSFDCEEEYILEEGDMLYLPPHVAHYGIALDKECMTYSFGYRAYQEQELWDSFAEFFADKATVTNLYKDPDWTGLSKTSELPKEAWLKAKEFLTNQLNNEEHLKRWFASFITSLDSEAEALLPIPQEDEEKLSKNELLKALDESGGLLRNPLCRFAYIEEEDKLLLFINGCEWPLKNVNADLIRLVANEREIKADSLKPFLLSAEDYKFILELLELEWLDFYAE